MSTIYTPKAQRYSPNDPFFQDGDIEIRAILLKRQARNVVDMDMIQEESMQLIHIQQPSDDIYCARCRIHFPTLTAYESHYDTAHVHVCLDCHKVFPGSKWLRLHTDEFHNMLLTLKRERGDKIYGCYVEDCKKVFKNQYMRRLHLIDKHKYPTFFPFDLVLTGIMSFEQRRKRDEKKKANKKNNNKKVDNMDVLMEDITTHISNLKIRTPTSIAFGRSSHSRQVSFHNTRKKQKDSMDTEMAEASNRPKRKRGKKKKKDHTQSTSSTGNPPSDSFIK